MKEFDVTSMKEDAAAGVDEGCLGVEGANNPLIDKLLPSCSAFFCAAVIALKLACAPLPSSFMSLRLRDFVGLVNVEELELELEWATPLCFVVVFTEDTDVEVNDVFGLG